LGIAPRREGAEKSELLLLVISYQAKKDKRDKPNKLEGSVGAVFNRDPAGKTSRPPTSDL